MIGVFDILSFFFDGPTSKEMEQAEIDIERARAEGDGGKTAKAILIYVFGLISTVVCIVVTLSFLFE